MRELKLKQFLKTKTAYYLIAAVILLVMFLVAVVSSKGLGSNPGDSGIVDEIAHIPSGYSYDKYGDYRLNPEHPPLAKALAGLPLALDFKIKGLKSDWSWEGINQWEAGWFMLYEAGNDPAQVLFWSRLPMILLMIFLGLFLLKWATELFGKKVGLLVLSLFAFYPDILAHGRLVTTDVPAALGFVISVYYFDKALKEKTKKSVFVAGLAFGAAQLLKFSAFLLFGILPLLALVKAIIDRKEGFWHKFWQNLKPAILTCVISLFVVWLAYIPFVAKTPPSVEHRVIEVNLTDDSRTLPLRNFLHKFENNTVSRALGHYFLGVMMVIGRVEGGNATYIMGQLSEKSISWFFPVAYLLKTPISIILFLLSAIGLIIRRRSKDEKEKWLLALLLTPVLVYWGFTLKGSLNIGIRHLMPTVPFVLLLIGYWFWHVFKSKTLWLKVVSLGLVLYLIISTLSNYPNFIAYFNEFTPRDQRHERLVDSSLDWGQDLLRLKKYVDDNRINSIKVDYFGGSVPGYYIAQSREWHSSYGPTTGWIAVSATFYQSSKLYGPKEGKWSYEWLDNFKPKAIIGGSILVYNISEEELRQNPPHPSYPITKIDFPSSLPTNQIFQNQK